MSIIWALRSILMIGLRRIACLNSCSHSPGTLPARLTILNGISNWNASTIVPSGFAICLTACAGSMLIRSARTTFSHYENEYWSFYIHFQWTILMSMKIRRSMFTPVKSYDASVLNYYLTDVTETFRTLACSEQSKSMKVSKIMEKTSLASGLATLFSAIPTLFPYRKRPRRMEKVHNRSMSVMPTITVEHHVSLQTRYEYSYNTRLSCQQIDFLVKVCLEKDGDEEGSSVYSITIYGTPLLQSAVSHMHEFSITICNLYVLWVSCAVKTVPFTQKP